MDEASVPRRHRLPKRLRVLSTDEWVALARTVNLLVLAVDGLDAHARDFILERERDVTPLVTLAWDLREMMGQLERKVVQATLPLPERPAELADPDRQPA